MPTIDLFKQCMRNYATGVTVITTLNNAQQNVGITINSFTSVSLDPLLVLFCLKKKCYAHSSFIEKNDFTINILSKIQQNVAMLFTKPTSEKWSAAQHDHKHATTKSATIKDCLAFIECKAHKIYDGGDHDIIIGKVINLHDNPSQHEALIYHQGNFLK